ncbi:MAG: OmpA family protein [Mangrovibacterium sp.]
MKKRILFVAVALALGGLTATAQEQEQKPARDYNKWSIDGGVGFNKAWRDFTPGYGSKTPSFLTGDLGVRYMWSQNLGLKLDYGYNNIAPSDGSKNFDAAYSRVNLQAVINAGKVLDFAEWTKTIGLLVHAGPGVGFLNSDAIDAADKQINFMGGATLQFRLSDRIALNLDGSATLPLMKDDLAWDGYGASQRQGVLFNGSLGLSVYLGKKEVHSDWYVAPDKSAEMEAQIAELSAKIDKYQSEAADAADVVANQQGINKLAGDIAGLKNVENVGNYDDFVKLLTEQGFVSAFFAYDSSRISASSINNINFLKTYLENNPSATVEVQGYTDGKGDASYNQKLSEKRAQTAAKLLTEAGISASRVKAVGMGIDSNVDVNSANARQIARRAIFIIK